MRWPRKGDRDDGDKNIILKYFNGLKMCLFKENFLKFIDFIYICKPRVF